MSREKKRTQKPKGYLSCLMGIILISKGPYLEPNKGRSRAAKKGECDGCIGVRVRRVGVELHG